MDIEYVRQRITELRVKRNISEYQLSYNVGHSKNYVHNIVSGYSQPSVKELLYLIEALGVTPLKCTIIVNVPRFWGAFF